MMGISLVWGAIITITSLLSGFGLRVLVESNRKNTLIKSIKDLDDEFKEQRKHLKEQAEIEAESIIQESKQEASEIRKDARTLEKHLINRE